MRSRRWHKLIIEQNTPTRSSTGEPVESWSTFAEVWGIVEPGRSREFFSARATQSDLSHEITIRYIPGVRSTMRVKYGERYLYLSGAGSNPGERNQYLILQAIERT